VSAHCSFLFYWPWYAAISSFYLAPTSYHLRRGREDDLPRVLALIQELAAYERAPEAVTNTLEMMRQDGFGPAPIFGFFVLEDGPNLLGLALYYTAYSTWKGRMLYLEDLVVTEAARRGGYGRLLFDAVVAEARRTGAQRLKWQVLDWNEPAISFYKKHSSPLAHQFAHFIDCYVLFKITWQSTC
jgi:GNAT superfamily N-acetyltransferase